LSCELYERGYVVLPCVIDEAAVTALRDALSQILDGCVDSVRSRNTSVYAVRNLLALSPTVRQLADSQEVRRVVGPLLGGDAIVVRAILFDKTAGANWKVACHQDLSIAVRERIDVPGFGPWSVKAGVVHVQPPQEILERMVTLRLHLDDCSAENGALQVIPGSHREGVLSPAQVEDWRRRVQPVPCCVPAGGALLMRPLLLHASSSATAPGHRRVIHLEWSADELPEGLEWNEGNGT
jgi:ectoine hydroxylase-related dioxygenase (phytanoyl-CoA dioxygenase family)